MCRFCGAESSGPFCDDRCRDWEIERHRGRAARIWYETHEIVRDGDGRVSKMFLFPWRPITNHLPCDETTE